MYIKPVIHVGWTLWITVVLITNIVDFFSGGGNFALIKKTTAIYHVSDFFNQLLHNGVILWQVIIVCLFWYVCVNLVKYGEKKDIGLRLAYGVSLSFWLALMIANEVFRSYALEAAPVRIFIAQMATLIFFFLPFHTTK